MAEFLTNVRTALEQASTLSCTNVLSFEHVVNGPWCRMQRPLLAFGALTFGRLALTSAASLVTGVAAAVQRGPANAHALGRLGLTLMANRLGRGAATSALNDDGLLAVTTASSMANLLAWMTAWQCLTAWLCTAWNVVLARLSCRIRDLLEWRLPTWTVCDDVWRSGAM